MPTSKKQLTKLNQVKMAKAEELSKQAAAGSKDAKKKLEEAREETQVSLRETASLIFLVSAAFAYLFWQRHPYTK